MPAHRLGFIGGGLSSAVGQTHFSACHMDGYWRLEAGAFSANTQTNQATGETWHISPKRLYTNWQTLLEQESNTLAAVAVLTPTPLHAEMVCQLLEHSIPVICEKALAVNLLEVEQITATLGQKNGFLAVTYNYTGYPMVREMRTWIREGKIGQIQQIHLEMPQEGFVRPPDIAGQHTGPQAWRLVDNHQVPTLCLDLADHLQHMVHFLLGNEPAEVMADYANFSHYPKLVDNAALWIRYQDGVKGVIWMSKTAIGYRNGLKVRVFGDQGTMEWYQMVPEELVVSLLDGSRLTLDRSSQMNEAYKARYNRFKAGHPSGFIEAYANLYTDMADALTQHLAGTPIDNPYVFGWADAKRGLDIFTAATQSHHTGRWCEI